MSYDQFQHPDGSMKSSAERAEYRRAQDRAKQLATATAAAAARKNAPATSGHEERIAEYKDMLKRAFSRADREQVKRRLVQHQEAHEQWQQQQDVAKFEADFDRSDLAKLAGESVERIRRSGDRMYPNATADQLDQLVALHEVRHEFPSPGDFAREFFTTLSAIEDGEAAAASTKAAEAAEAMSKAELENAQANLARAEAQQRAQTARSAIE